MKSLLTFFLVVLLTSALSAQTTSIQLSTEADASSNFRVLNSLGVTRFQVNSDGGFYIRGIDGTGTIPATGVGCRFMWYPRKSVFRAGYVEGTQWDDASIGYSSMAIGYNTTANASYSTAMGFGTTASGNASTAMGRQTTASASSSTAMGLNTIASGSASTAMGSNTTASGNFSTALGYYTIATGMYSTAFGNSTIAEGSASTSLGYNTTAREMASTAMGSYVKANHQGSFIIGDYSKLNYDSSSASNEMTMRFAGGYRIYSNSGCTTGAYMNAGANGWTAYCDRNRKENFHPIDGEQILLKIREMPITQWNYKGTDPTVKYIGPVAQDFYSAFHLGGTDSLGINTICIDGVNIAAIQALEKRTAELQRANEKITSIEKNNSEMQKRIEKLENIIASMTKDNDKQITSSK
jgi:hypothetical protein